MNSHHLVAEDSGYATQAGGGINQYINSIYTGLVYVLCTDVVYLQLSIKRSY